MSKITESSIDGIDTIDGAINEPTPQNEKTSSSVQKYDSIDEYLNSGKIPFTQVNETSYDNFSHLKSIQFETWQTYNNIQAKVVSYNKDVVTCECLLDETEMILENRQFQASLFDHLKVSIDMLVLISIKSKPGSIKMDVYKGQGFTNPKLFGLGKEDVDLDLAWARIENSNLESPFEFNIPDEA